MNLSTGLSRWMNIFIEISKMIIDGRDMHYNLKNNKMLENCVSINSNDYSVIRMYILIDSTSRNPNRIKCYKMLSY